MAATIDALGLAEDFEKAGFPHAIRDHSHATLASKADLHELELRLEVRFAQVEQKIAEVQIGLIKWFTGIMFAQAAAIVALIKLLPGLS